jgi:predicted metal-binding protein
MKIAIMNCMNTSKSCTTSSCFNAYNGGTHAFEAYGDDKPVLLGLFNCSGCGIDRKTDENFQKKITRLKNEGVSRVHISNCAKNCGNVPAMQEVFAENGIETVLGTH